MDEEKYKNFADDVYDTGETLGKAMRKEIVAIIERSLNSELATEEIMSLIFATKYEW